MCFSLEDEYRTREHAAIAWNTRAKTKLLTIEEIRTVINPWVVNTHSADSIEALVKAIHAVGPSKSDAQINFLMEELSEVSQANRLNGDYIVELKAELAKKNVPNTMVI
jgi:hypothetical protein